MSRLELSLLSCLLLAGCGSPAKIVDPERDPKNPIGRHFDGSDLYHGVPDNYIKTDDDDVKFSDEKGFDPQQVAMWAKDRRDAITWCLNQHVTEANDFSGEENYYKRVWPDDDRRPETRLDQAIAIATKVVEKVPDNTRERARLAWSLFNRGSRCYWAVDACMNRIGVLKAEIGDDEKNPDPQYSKQVKEIAHLREIAAKESMDMLAYHRAALKHFNVYMNAMPMDKAVLDFIWKIHFQLGDFREAVRNMNLLLDEDLLKDEVRVEYIKIRKDINDYLVEREINKDAKLPVDRHVLRKPGDQPNR